MNKEQYSEQKSKFIPQNTHLRTNCLAVANYHQLNPKEKLSWPFLWVRVVESYTKYLSWVSLKLSARISVSHEGLAGEGSTSQLIRTSESSLQFLVSTELSIRQPSSLQAVEHPSIPWHRALLRVQNIIMTCSEQADMRIRPRWKSLSSCNLSPWKSLITSTLCSLESHYTKPSLH